jgi:hypothetical protein
MSFARDQTVYLAKRIPLHPKYLVGTRGWILTAALEGDPLSWRNYPEVHFEGHFASVCLPESMLRATR